MKKLSPPQYPAHHAKDFSTFGKASYSNKTALVF